MMHKKKADIIEEIGEKDVKYPEKISPTRKRR